MSIPNIAREIDKKDIGGYFRRKAKDWRTVCIYISLEMNLLFGKLP
jgi:hypothetical protein